MDEKPDKVSDGMWANIQSVARSFATSPYTQNIVYWMSSSLTTASLVKRYENPSKRVASIPSSVPSDESRNKGLRNTRVKLSYTTFLAAGKDGENGLEQFTTLNNRTDGPQSSFLLVTTSEENPSKRVASIPNSVPSDESRNKGAAKCQPGEVNVWTNIPEVISKPGNSLQAQTSVEADGGNVDPERAVPKEIVTPTKGTNQYVIQKGAAKCQPGEENVWTNMPEVEVISMPRYPLLVQTSVEADGGNVDPERTVPKEIITGTKGTNQDVIKKDKKDFLIIHSEIDGQQALLFMKDLQEIGNKNNIMPPVTGEVFGLITGGENTLGSVSSWHDEYRCILVFVTNEFQTDDNKKYHSECVIVWGLDVGGNKRHRVVPVWVDTSRVSCTIPFLKLVTGISYPRKMTPFAEEQVLKILREFRNKIP